MSSDALSGLVVGEDELSGQLLGNTLRPFLSFTKAGEIILETGFDLLGAQEKLLAVFLGLRGLQRLKMSVSASANPSQAAELSGLPGGTVRPGLRKLVSRGLLRGTKGSYELPVSQIRRASALLRDPNEAKRNGGNTHD